MELSPREKDKLLIYMAGELAEKRRARGDSDIELNVGQKTIKVKVSNSGDRPIQIGSHYHFYEANLGLKFDREPTKGFRLNIAAGTAVRFEPGQVREVELVEYAGTKTIYGFRGDIMGKL